MTEQPTPPLPSSPSPAIYDGAISGERTGFEAAASLLPQSAVEQWGPTEPPLLHLRCQEVVGMGRRCGLPLLSSDGAWTSPPSSPRPADPSATSSGGAERASATSSGDADLTLAMEVPTEKSRNVDGTIGWVGVGLTR
jgi:hypothetical protein